MGLFQIAKRIRVYRDFLQGTAFLKSIYYNMIKRNIERPNGGILLIGKDATISMHKDGCIIVLGRWAKIGYGNVPRNGRKASIEIWKKGKLILEQDSLIYQDADITILENAVLHLGADSIINRKDTIVVSERITIGDGCRLAPGVTIRDAMGQTIDGGRVCDPVDIGDHVWLCTNATILPGVRIGKGSIVAAHAVLKDSLPDRVMAAGIPAIIKKTNVTWGYPDRM